MLSINNHLLNYDDGLGPIVGIELKRLETHRDFFLRIQACRKYIHVLRSLRAGRSGSRVWQ